jgi:hypothetical protein
MLKASKLPGPDISGNGAGSPVCQRLPRSCGEDLLISLPDGFHLYGFFSTGLASRLVEGSPGPCTFLVPPGALEEVPAELRQRAQWRAFPHHRLSLVEETISFVRRTATRHLIPGATRNLMHRKVKAFGRTRWKRFFLPAGRLLAAYPGLDRGILALERLLAPSPLSQILNAEDFKTVVFGSAGVKNLDMAVMHLVGRGRTGLYGIIYSWDNITSKYNYFNRFQRLAVWNGIVKKEAIDYLGYRPEQVAVIGVPQFDLYYGFAPRESREDFLRRLDLPAGARYVLYAGAIPETCPWGAEYVELILKALPHHFVLVRAHPQDASDGYRPLADHPRVRVFRPGAPGAGSPRNLGFWLPRHDEGYTLAEQIFFAESVVSIASTVTLDALFLNRPALNIAFDGASSPFVIAMREYYDTNHFRYVARSGAVPLAGSPGELAEALQSVDQWWPHRAAEVQALKNLIDPFGDGQATRRLAEDILAFHRAGAGLKTCQSWG